MTTTKKRTTKAKTATPRKKTAVRKKTTTKKKETVIAPHDQRFWVWNGPVLDNLWALRDALENDISDIQFEYHCSDGKCDFALWVDDVLCDATCARALAKATNKKEAAKAVASCLKKYK